MNEKNVSFGMIVLIIKKIYDRLEMKNSLKKMDIMFMLFLLIFSDCCCFLYLKSLKMMKIKKVKL